jgi:hypothetical protein
MNKTINGFSKLSKQGKINWLTSHFLENMPEKADVIASNDFNREERSGTEGYPKHILQLYIKSYFSADC